MEKLKLYSSLLSANGRKVQAICDALNIDATVIETNVYDGEGRNPEYLKKNPLGQIPTLVDDKITLIESNAIAIYLSERYGNMSLYGSSPLQRAEINKWLFWESSQWQPLLTQMLGPYVGHRLLPHPVSAPQAKPNWEADLIVAQIRYLEASLSNKNRLVGSELSLADYVVAGMTTYFNASEFPFESYPNVSTWLKRLSENKSWRSTEHPLWS